MEQTLVMLKPKPELYTWHNQEYFLEVIRKHTQKVWCIILDEKTKKFTTQEAILHYKHLRFVTFFPEIVDYIISWDCKLLHISWEDSIKKMQEFKKELRKKHNCNPWLFDWIYNKKPIYNILHTSDSKKEAEREVNRYFSKKES